MDDVVVGLDLHMKNILGTIMKKNGELVKQEKFKTCKENLRRFLEGILEGTRVAFESVSFCWPWIDYVKKWVTCLYLLILWR